MVADGIDWRRAAVWPPGTLKPSSHSSTSAPMARRLVATAAMRSDSFTRNSARIADLECRRGVGRNGREHRQLVDQRRRQRAG